ncbi:hypothetical protein [Mycolicibacterium sp. XJ1819]
MAGTQAHRVHVVVGTPWKDAVISCLDSRSPYRPWPSLPDVRRGDTVVVAIDSEPRLVLTRVARAGRKGVAGAIAEISAWSVGQAVPASEVGLEDIDGRHLLVEGPEAAEFLQTLEQHVFDIEDTPSFGSSSMAAARILLRSGGNCAGCGTRFRLAAENARDAVGVWTVESLQYRPRQESALVESDADDDWDLYFQPRPPAIPVDWPAALCLNCQWAMRAFDSFLDYRFFRHPVCPECGGRQTQAALFGLLDPSARIAPWRDARGCCVQEDIWTCTLCLHR